RSTAAEAHVKREDLLLVERTLHDREAEVQGQRDRAGERRHDAEAEPGRNAVIRDVELALDGTVVEEAHDEELVVGEYGYLILNTVEEGKLAAHIQAVLIRADAAEGEAAEAVETAGVETLEDRGVVARSQQLAADRQHMFAAAVTPLPGRP